MRKIFLILFLSIVGYSLTHAQVDNYALRLSKEASVDFKYIPELNNLSTYTIQFWFNPNTWAKGATLFTRDEGASLFAMRLGEKGILEYCVGNEVVSISDPAFDADKWAQVTIVYNGVTLSAFVNNVEKTITANGNYILPPSQAFFKMGGKYEGRLDEIRLYQVAVAPDYLLWKNTLNHLHPNWNDLISYWKLDQFCDNIADYKLIHNGERTSGAVRELVTDNASFDYKITTAYTGFARFFDRYFDTHKVLLTNDLLLLICRSTKEGTIRMNEPESSGVLTGCTHLQEFEGRKGVLSFNGAGAQMNVGRDALTPVSESVATNDGSYTFSTWVYINNWTKDAYLLRKEANGQVGFSVRLGDQATHELIARINGNEFKVVDKLTTGKWIHVSVGGIKHNINQPKYVIKFAFDGTSAWASTTPATKVDYKIAEGNDTDALIGVNFDGKLDMTEIWHKDMIVQSEDLRNNGVPMPNFKKYLSESLPGDCNAYYTYDDATRPGFDCYSHTGFREILTAPYKNHRGFKVRIAVMGHDSWQSDFGIESYRKKLAQSIADLTKMGYDGVELDHEWCYSDPTCNRNYGKMVQDIRAVMPEGKLLTVSPHNVSYAFPAEYIPYADYYSFQIYGPNKGEFMRSTVDGCEDKYIRQGYPKDKINLSFSPMTSCPHDKNGARLPGAEIALWFFEDSYTDPTLDYYLDSEGRYYWFTGVEQARWRCQYVIDKGLNGIMYWDMGADKRDTTDPMSVVRSASFAINANVDTIITNAPIATGLPEVVVNKKQIQTYLSPDKKTLTLLVPQGMPITDVEIMDIDGRLIYRQEVSERSNNRIDISVENYSRGVYLVKAKLENDVLTQKFLK